MSYFIHNNEDPFGMVILHNCDNGKCVNPNHLHLGTYKDNSKDMINKGRGKEQFLDGEKHKNAKLTEKDIEDIKIQYKNGESQGKLSLKYKVYQSTISRIVNGKRWNHNYSQ